MTNASNDKNNRLDRIEAIVESNARAIQATSDAIQTTTDNLNKLDSQWQETKAIANSNARAIQAMIEQQATDRLKHDQEIAELKEISSRLADVQMGMARMLSNIDQTNPTILSKLNTIENKVDRILDQEQE